MNKSFLALAIAAMASALPVVSHAQGASPLSFNVGVTSDYRYRGVSQSRLNPALQGGVDYALPKGFYVGAWASTIQWIKDEGGDAPLELDVYGGYKGEISKDLTFDVGALSYLYPFHDLAVNPTTLELYGALSFGPTTVKYSHSVTNLFGLDNSKNSGYIEIGATFEVGGGFSVTPHVGYQRVAHHSARSYTDFSVTGSKEFAGFLVSASLVATDSKDEGGADTFASPANGKNLGRTGVVVAVKKTF